MLKLLDKLTLLSIIFITNIIAMLKSMEHKGKIIMVSLLDLIFLLNPYEMKEILIWIRRFLSSSRINKDGRSLWKK